MVFPKYSYGIPIIFIWYSYGFSMVFLGVPMVFLWYSYGLPKTQTPTVTDGSLTETDGSLTDTHGSEGQWSRRRWAAVRWILGLCWGRCPGMPLCRCAGVHVCRCAGDRGGVPICRRATLSLISLEVPFNCCMCLLELSYDFLQLP